MTDNNQTEDKTPAGSDEAQPEAAQANQATSESTDELSPDELSWEALDGVAGGVNGTATLTADLSD
jgi:hypothetical protein